MEVGNHYQNSNRVNIRVQKSDFEISARCVCEVATRVARSVIVEPARGSIRELTQRFHRSWRIKTIARNERVNFEDSCTDIRISSCICSVYKGVYEDNMFLFVIILSYFGKQQFLCVFWYVFKQYVFSIFICLLVGGKCNSSVWPILYHLYLIYRHFHICHIYVRLSGFIDIFLIIV